MGLALAASAAALGLAFGGALLMRAIVRSQTPNPNQPLELLEWAPQPVLNVDDYSQGRAAFTATCATCHAADGTGVRGLGKDLTRSQFVASMSDTALLAFLQRGRDVNDPLNTTKVPMPPRGGNPNFSDADLAHVVVFLRGLQDPRRVSDAARIAPVSVLATAPSEDDKAKALELAGGDAELAEWIAHGRTIFMASCAACHGKDARGMPNLGKDLVKSEFVGSLDDDQLLAFLMRGRDPSDPKNTTRVAMPPKGGNPALKESDLYDVIYFLRSLRPKTGAPAS
ncbi:MAG: cytochrome c [Phycisphaerales bacterium]